MLIYMCSNDYYHNIINLDNMVRLIAFEDKITMRGLDGNEYTIIECESEEEVNKIIKKIYFNMTHNIKNMILDLEEFRKEETEMARTRKASEDCISKSDIKKYLSAPDANGDRIIYESDLDLLPPVTPERPKGKWIEVEVHNCHATLKCSVCDRVIEPTFTFGEYSYEDIKKFYPYCHCGCRMIESQESDDAK